MLDYFLVFTVPLESMLYDGYHFVGMHLIWWFIWVVLLFWILATPYDSPYSLRRKSSALDILKKRFASGEINNEQYQEQKSILEKDLTK